MSRDFRSNLDLSLYLVTGRELLPPGKDYYESLEEALQGGVTIVQLREKDIETGEFIDIARRTKTITDKYDVPLLINDRIDVHLAIGSAGVHLGQSDCPLTTARQILGDKAIIGISTGTPDEAREAASDGADYIGIGAVWHTTSKDLKAKLPLGPDGAGLVLDALEGTDVLSVAIGGIHLSNLSHLLHGSVSPNTGRRLDGVAVISEIVSSKTPKESAQALRKVIDSAKRASSALNGNRAVFRSGVSADKTTADLLNAASNLLVVTRKETPLIHQITNNVVINDSANATLAVGASPIMATNSRDVVDLSPAIAALLVNFGTIADKEGMMAAGRHANINRKPIVFDPVAVGATSFRRETSQALLKHWQPTVIKGNAAEIGALAESKEVISRGVDSAGSGFANPADIVLHLARKRNVIVVLTGVSDYLSDGRIVLKISNGHSLLGTITGSGCMTGTLVATFCGAARLHHLATADLQEDDSQLTQGDMLIGALAGVLTINIAAEIAAAREDVKGPGTFRAALLDELYNLTPELILERANVEIVVDGT